MSIGVLGAGAWGTALAQMLASDGSAVTLWALEAEVADSINDAHENVDYLPGVPLSARIRATTSLNDIAACATILVVTPAQHCARIIASLPERGQDLLLCAKGMERGSARLMTEVVAEAKRKGAVAVLSGPTFAHEVAKGLPAAVTLAAADAATAQRIAETIARPAFRPYVSDDMIGAEIGGAVKNVLAIACGVVDGAALGENARAALIARGFAEMVRYGVARGAKVETLTGLAGLGDLVLTCSSTASRNFSLGRAIAGGADPAQLLADRRSVAEGAFSAGVLADDAARRGVDMPIVATVAALVAGDIRADAAIAALMARPLAREGWQQLG
jgi:glycerol-3-phosphate dehydrogenase (NAD(P)+)